MNNAQSELRLDDGTRGKRPGRSRTWDFSARGEPFLWGFGGALAFGVTMVFGFLLLVLWNGLAAFYPKPIYVVTLRDGSVLAGEKSRAESFQPDAETLETFGKEHRAAIAANGNVADRTLYRTGNYDLYHEDFRWVPDPLITKTTTPANVFFIERLEWGPFIGAIRSVDLNGNVVQGSKLSLDDLYTALEESASRREAIRKIERSDIGAVNYYMEEGRLALKKVGMKYGTRTRDYEQAQKTYENLCTRLKTRYRGLEKEAEKIKTRDARFKITLADVNGREKTLKVSEITRLYPANALAIPQKLGVYFSRWREFFTQEPREANTEGGVMPAIFGTCVMTLLMALAVAPFGVMAALYLREYAKQGRLVSAVRISVNNLAGVPSIVYGVFGLGFFAYIIGAGIDELLYAERLPNPTYGTGGLLWASFTLALLTVPVVIVATEEALAAVPQSMREGSLACGASKWQTVKHIVLPRAMPGIMTGLILAMARGAGEVAPLMLVGVVKLAPELPIDGFFPYVHLERSFMHLGFHIYDVGFQSRNSEAAKPMVFVTTLVLIGLVATMNAAAIIIRNRLKRRFSTGQF